MKDFVVIDFETANHHPSSVCSVGVVLVRNGVIEEKYYGLIKPTPNYYTEWATDCHGLSDEDTAHSPLFPEVWEEIADRIIGLPLVAHNCSFDERCLRNCHIEYGMPYPDYEFYCTLSASRNMFPELNNHRLPTVAAHVGFHIENHHNALSDAEACTAIALEVFD